MSHLRETTSPKGGSLLRRRLLPGLPVRPRIWEKDAGNKTKRSHLTEVLLRERSTPYDFAVTVSSSDRRLDLYRGQSYKNALQSYWQAVKILRHINGSGKVAMSLIVEEQPYGGFETRCPAKGKRRISHPVDALVGRIGRCSRRTFPSSSSRQFRESFVPSVIQGGTRGFGNWPTTFQINSEPYPWCPTTSEYWNGRAARRMFCECGRFCPPRGRELLEHPSSSTGSAMEVKAAYAEAPSSDTMRGTTPVGPVSRAQDRSGVEGAGYDRGGGVQIAGQFR